MSAYIDVDSREKALKNMAMLVYILFIASYFTVITAIIGVIIAHVKKGDAAGTIYESHFSNHIKVFWIGLLLGIVGVALAVILVGYLVLAVVAVWSIYRVIKGLIRLNDGRPM